MIFTLQNWFRINYVIILREARDLIFKIRSYSARSDLKNKQTIAENTLILRSLASLGFGLNGTSVTSNNSQNLFCNLKNLMAPWSVILKLVGSTFKISQKRKISPKRKFSAGRPCGHPAKNFSQALQVLEKEAFWHGHAARTSTKKLRSEKLRADFSSPNQRFEEGKREMRKLALL